jgi:hypothetical protein
LDEDGSDTKVYTDAKLMIVMNSLDVGDGLPQTLSISSSSDTEALLDNPSDGSNSSADGDEITVNAMNDPENSDFSDDEASFSDLILDFDGDELTGDVNACYCAGLSEQFGGGEEGDPDKDAGDGPDK